MPIHPRPLKILALDPYHGGSHRQFAEGLAQRSRHRLELVSLPPRHFKWRMRGAAVTLARRLRQPDLDHQSWDLLFATSAMNACELRGLLPPRLQQLPLVVYFHEHQIGYPTRNPDPRDIHFALTNWLSALSASEAWFNSEYTRRSFLEGMHALLKQMPDERELGTLAEIEAKSAIQPLGIDDALAAAQTRGPLHILWSSRWEHDKNPEDFWLALRELEEAGTDFVLTLLGQRFREQSPSLRKIEAHFASRILGGDFLEDTCAYQHALSQADVVVSTAHHEFFGVATLEAVAAGCVPALPRRLVYPELYPADCLFGSTPGELASLLQRFAQEKATSGTLAGLHQRLGLGLIAQRFRWSTRANELDCAFERVVETCHVARES